MTDLTKYARSLKRNYKDRVRDDERLMEDSGFIKGTPGMERAMKQMQKAGNNYAPDIPKLVSLKASKESPLGGSKPFPDYDFKQSKQKDFSKMQFLDEGMKKGGKVSSASSRADGIAQRGKTKGRYL
jgi:hypothetical protein